MKHYITLKQGREKKKHYENFPVATLLYPKQIREAAIILYHFARTADDIADEGNLAKKERLMKIQIYEENLKKIKNNNQNVDPLFQDIFKIIDNFSISINLFERFIKAFKQDITKNRYNNFAQLTNYIDNAAAPAGEMILSLFKQNTKQNIKYSNAICQAFALIGMAQDFNEDILKDRLYIPTIEMKRFNLNISDIQNKIFNNNWKIFKRFWLKRVQLILNKGVPLKNNTKGRLSLQIKIMLAAVSLLIERMQKDNCDLFNNPPKLSKLDWLVLFCRCILLK